VTLHVGEWSNAADTRRADRDRPLGQSVILRTIVLAAYVIASVLLIYYCLFPLRPIDLQSATQARQYWI
jgi:hypothetical protein